MPLVATSTQRLGNLVKEEFWPTHGWCRQVVTVNIATGRDVKLGTVLGKVTADGKFKDVDPAAVDGSQDGAAVVLFDTTVASATDTEVTVAVRGPMILSRDALIYEVAHDATQKAAVEADLAALDILVRPTA